MDVLAPLALLACPLSMGLMMFFMGRGKQGGSRDTQPASVDVLRAEQARLGDQIEVLERTGTPIELERLAQRT